MVVYSAPSKVQTRWGYMYFWLSFLLFRRLVFGNSAERANDIELNKSME